MESPEMSGDDLPLTLYVTSRNSMIGSAVAEEMRASFDSTGPIEPAASGAYHSASNSPHRY
jgi:hypothetical protein